MLPQLLPIWLCLAAIEGRCPCPCCVQNPPPPRLTSPSPYADAHPPPLPPLPHPQIAKSNNYAAPLTSDDDGEAVAPPDLIRLLNPVVIYATDIPVLDGLFYETAMSVAQLVFHINVLQKQVIKL